MARLSFVPLMAAAKPVSELPEGDEWEYEAKLDGYRGLLLRDERGVHILSRNDNDLTRNYPPIVQAATRMPMHRVALDGEIVALDKNGRPDFQALQHSSRAHLIVFDAFDVLHLNGRDMHKQTLEKRRSKLSDVVGDSGIRVSVELPGTAANVIASVQALGLEGVVAKLRTSPYDPALEDAWVKVRFDRHQEFVVGGYQGDRTRPDKAARDVHREEI